MTAGYGWVAATALVLALGFTMASGAAQASDEAKPESDAAKDAAATTEQQTSSDGANAPDDESDPVMAIVNGEEIRRSDALRARSRLPEPVRDMPEDVVLRVLTQMVIDTRLVAAEARTQGVDEREPIQDRIRYMTDIVLEQELLRSYLNDQVTEDAILNQYNVLAEDEAARDQVKIRHILVADEAAAKEVIAQLDNGGDFAAIAKEHSTDTTAETGGEIGYVARSEMLPALRAGASALEIGAYSKSPIETEFGWHVIQLQDVRVLEMPPLDDRLKAHLRQVMADDLRKQYVSRLRDNADVEFLIP